MTRKILSSLVFTGFMAPMVAQAGPVRLVSHLERDQPKARPTAPTSKVGATRCEPKETTDGELRELDRDAFIGVSFKDADALARLYKGFVTLHASKSKSTHTALIPKYFQAVVTKRTDGAIKALEVTYRFISQQLVAAIKFSTEAHKSAKAKHEPNDPKAGEYARTLYASARRLLDGVENLRKFEVHQLGEVFWKRVFVTAKLGETLVERINRALATQPYSIKLMNDVPADRQGPTGTPLAAAGLALTHARHAVDTYRAAISEVLRAGKEKEPAAMLNRNGGSVVQACFFHAKDAFNSLVDRIKTDMEEDEPAAEDSPAEE